jgi:phosphoribosylformylglycinamidine synthase subunit PurSL
VERLTIRSATPDPRNGALLADAHALGLGQIEAIEVADLVFVKGAVDRQRLHELLVEPMLQHGDWTIPSGVAIETALLPGVTDAAAQAVALAAHTIGATVDGVATGTRYEVRGNVDADTLSQLAGKLLANEVIERWASGTIEPAFVDADASADIGVETVDLDGLDDTELEALNKQRGLSLDLAELHAIARHFRSIGRAPTDVELETLAQTWSEHCAHKTFRARITTADGRAVEPLLHQLRAATQAIDAPFVRSSFVGNAGIVSFAPGTTIAVKAETHNHPSAIEPFGGANTGVGGVIRDVMGAGHHPIATTDVLCFGPHDLPAHLLPEGVLHPRLIEAGVIAGVADYGNKIGLPTVAGAVLYDPGYIANPLVYCGCIGVATDAPPPDGPHAGDLVVVLGGRTGRDGLRGATFSSATMDASTGDVAGASVQIGDPITEKLLIDVLAEGSHLYTAITDCGAGGFSSAIGEMAEGIGADIDLAEAPLKYPGLRPWEVWLSEAQERMVVAVAPHRLTELDALCARHGVEATVLGTFTGDGVLHVHYAGTTVLRLDTTFLHDGRPARQMQAVLPSPSRHAAKPPVCADAGATLLALLRHPNIASKARVIRRYDHEIRGTSVVRPLVGVAGDAPADGVVLADPADTHGLAIGIGVNPWFGELDPERMAHAVVDEAIRNVVAVGADPDAVALLDNFSWGDPRRPTTLGELVAAVRGCCDASVAHGAPFVSGKDSLNNEYLGADGARHAVPPTLVITAVAHVPDANAVITPDLKQAGNVVVQIGRTACEFGGSHFSKVHSDADAHPTPMPVPAPNPDAPARYRRLHRALRSGRIMSCHDLSEGGLAVALAEMSIGGGLGIHVRTLPAPDPFSALFAESTGRFVCELATDDIAWLEGELGEPVTALGTVTTEPVLSIAAAGVSLSVEQLRAAFGGRP